MTVDEKEEKLIIIDRNKCMGCGSCVNTCPNGGFRVRNGKAEVIQENFCDGLGYCIERCPMGAINYKGKNVEDVSCFITDKPRIANWPIKLHLVNPEIFHFKDADLAIVADCTAFVYKNFEDIAKDHVVLTYCPKLENTRQVREKIIKILENNSIKSVTSYNVDYICCENLSRTIKDAVRFSSKKEQLLDSFKHNTICLFGVRK